MGCSLACTHVEPHIRLLVNVSADTPTPVLQSLHGEGKRTMRLRLGQQTKSMRAAMAVPSCYIGGEGGAN